MTGGSLNRNNMLIFIDKLYTRISIDKKKDTNLYYIYKEECLSVCLFAMHSVPVIASVTKLSMPLP